LRIPWRSDQNSGGWTMPSIRAKKNAGESTGPPVVQSSEMPFLKALNNRPGSRLVANNEVLALPSHLVLDCKL
jgi:hypothetical protein